MEIMQIENDGTSPHRGGVEVRVCGAGELRLSPMLPTKSPRKGDGKGHALAVGTGRVLVW
jgi:hypothetical protein